MVVLEGERLDWLAVILKERFGLVVHLQVEPFEIALNLPGHEGRIAFDVYHRTEVSPSRDELPCGLWNAKQEGWQAISEKPLPAPGYANLRFPLIEKQGGETRIHFDLLGMIFWVLTRIEEIGSTEKDRHGRFPATASHAYRHGYLDRPLVDEWLHILGQVIQLQWPRAELVRHQFSTLVSHDVDCPFQYRFVSRKGIARQMAGDMLKRKRVGLAIARFQTWRGVVSGDLELDPFNTFDWIMDVSESQDIKSEFYFICGRTNEAMDADYEVEHPVIRSLICQIAARGHIVGLHPSYETYLSGEKIANEARRLRKVCAEAAIKQDNWGARMHYLRWEHPATMHALEAAGIDYDASLGYADHVGFRCGTCFEFPAFDPVYNKALRLRLRPLIAMESSVFGSEYMGLRGDDALAQLTTLKRRCKAVEGVFSLLWHNSNLITSPDRLLYKAVLS